MMFRWIFDETDDQIGILESMERLNLMHFGRIYESILVIIIYNINRLNVYVKKDSRDWFVSKIKLHIPCCIFLNSIQRRNIKKKKKRRRRTNKVYHMECCIYYHEVYSGEKNKLCRNRIYLFFLFSNPPLRGQVEFLPIFSLCCWCKISFLSKFFESWENHIFVYFSHLCKISLSNPSN